MSTWCHLLYSSDFDTYFQVLFILQEIHGNFTYNNNYSKAGNILFSSMQILLWMLLQRIASMQTYLNVLEFYFGIACTIFHDYLTDEITPVSVRERNFLDDKMASRKRPVIVSRSNGLCLLIILHVQVILKRNENENSDFIYLPSSCSKRYFEGL